MRNATAKPEPRTVRAINQTRGSMLCPRLEEAAGHLARSRGLIGRDRLKPGEGLLIVRGRFEPFLWMHMFFVRFPIDIVFVDRGGVIVHIDRALRPWRLSSIVFGAVQALELPAGACDASGTRIGDSIRFEECGRDEYNERR